eukprot:scaffold48255_cov60-Phaeocystis_antarctica.AAC.1
MLRLARRSLEKSAAASPVQRRDVSQSPWPGHRSSSRDLAACPVPGRHVVCESKERIQMKNVGSTSTRKPVPHLLSCVCRAPKTEKRESLL